MKIMWNTHDQRFMIDDHNIQLTIFKRMKPKDIIHKLYIICIQYILVYIVCKGRLKDSCENKLLTSFDTRYLIYLKSCIILFGVDSGDICCVACWKRTKSHYYIVPFSYRTTCIAWEAYSRAYFRVSKISGLSTTSCTDSLCRQKKGSRCFFMNLNWIYSMIHFTNNNFILLSSSPLEIESRNTPINNYE